MEEQPCSTVVLPISVNNFCAASDLYLLVKDIPNITNLGSGLLISDIGGTLLNTSAWPYTMEDLESANHIHELPRRENITFNIDYKQQGVGGDLPAIAMLHKEFKLKGGIPYTYCFRLRPYTKDIGDFSSVAFKIPPKL